MSAYETDDQQVEAIKKWWRENGKALIFGAVLAVAGVGVGSYWFQYQSGRAESASVEYGQLLSELGQDNREAVLKRGEFLVNTYPKTGYAALAALIVAKARVEAGEMAAARAQLQWVIDNADLPELKNVARLRLARIQLAEGNAQQALATLSGIEGNAFAAAAEEIRGDAYMAQGDTGAARTAYQKALDVSEPGSDTRLLRMKLDNIGSPLKADA
ncbi:MAG TPA: tetratricopeptide repeat protein [Gammaproteobacteria bacterium]|nr:tetratricopeptide repeat protein [Gammaproteobacteria bacterium]